MRQEGSCHSAKTKFCRELLEPVANYGPRAFFCTRAPKKEQGWKSQPCSHIDANSINLKNKG